MRTILWLLTVVPGPVTAFVSNLELYQLCIQPDWQDFDSFL